MSGKKRLSIAKLSPYQLFVLAQTRSINDWESRSWVNFVIIGGFMYSGYEIGDWRIFKEYALRFNMGLLPPKCRIEQRDLEFKTNPGYGDVSNEDYIRRIKSSY